MLEQCLILKIILSATDILTPMVFVVVVDVVLVVVVVGVVVVVALKVIKVRQIYLSQFKLLTPRVT